FNFSDSDIGAAVARNAALGGLALSNACGRYGAGPIRANRSARPPILASRSGAWDTARKHCGGGGHSGSRSRTHVGWLADACRRRSPPVWLRELPRSNPGVGRFSVGGR